MLYTAFPSDKEYAKRIASDETVEIQAGLLQRAKEAGRRNFFLLK
jgi:hypothetical protein